jgi:putative tricarboxylic transport membrane protein
MERDAGARFKFVTFKSGIAAALAVAGGHVVFTTENISETQALVEAKKIKLLATSGNKRASFAPEVPTLKEMGYPIVLGTGRGFAMPAGVSKEAAAVMEAVLKRVHDSAAWKDFVARNAYEDVYLNGADFSAYLVRNREDMAKFLAAIGVTQIQK